MMKVTQAERLLTRSVPHGRRYLCGLKPTLRAALKDCTKVLRPGRPSALSPDEIETLCGIIDSGPVAYGLDTGVWTSPLIRDVIVDEFRVKYHEGHVRKLLKEFGFSVQRPKRFLALADQQKRREWIKERYPKIKKKAKKSRSPIVFEDECSFRQDATLHATWARIGKQPTIPVKGQRKSIKVFGCVDITSSRFINKTDEVFNGTTYGAFLEKVATRFFTDDRKVQYIQDHAPYHKNKEVWAWFKKNKRFIEVHNLPPYCPELNATERLWQHTRRSGTHNRYFATQEEMVSTLHSVFRRMQKKPQDIRGYLIPFL